MMFIDAMEIQGEADFGRDNVLELTIPEALFREVKSLGFVLASGDTWQSSLRGLGSSELNAIDEFIAENLSLYTSWTTDDIDRIVVYVESGESF